MSFSTYYTPRMTLLGRQPTVATKYLLQYINLGINTDRNVSLGTESGVKYDQSQVQILNEDGTITGSPNGEGFNVKLGFKCGYYNQTGRFNTYLGYLTAYGGETNDGGNIDSNLYTQSDRNVMIGYQTGQFIGTEANDNVFVGTQAGRGDFNTKFTGDNNIFVGDSCGYSITTATNNVFMGNLCGYNNTIGNNNVGIGYKCMQYSQYHNNNVAIGTNCLSGNSTINLSTEVNNNVAIGYNCGNNINYNSGNNINNNILIGSDVATSTTFRGDDNVFIGRYSGGNCVSGQGNIGIGLSSLQNITSGNVNISIGTDNCTNINSGGGNVCIGNNSANVITNNSNNVCIGNLTNVSNSSINNSISLGLSTIANQSNALFAIVRSANVGGNTLRYQVSTRELVDDTSSKKYKTNIKTFIDKTNCIDKFRPVLFNPLYKKDNNFENPSIPSKKIMFGLIAEEVAEIFPYVINYADIEEKIPHGISYDYLVPLVIHHIQRIRKRLNILENNNKNIENNNKNIEKNSKNIEKNSKNIENLETKLFEYSNNLQNKNNELDKLKIQITELQSEKEYLISRLTTLESKIATLLT